MARPLVCLSQSLRWIVCLAALMSACPPVTVAQSSPPAAAAAPTLLGTAACAAIDAAIKQQIRED